MTAAALRLDVALVRRGLVRSRGRAAELVAEGRVHIGESTARKPSQPVRDDDELRVAGTSPEYVSRAGHKLAGALDAIARLAPGAVRVDAARCLDVGACTGGFTQVLLERGAAHVTAVDVGHGQLAPELTQHPRVTSAEGTDVRDLDPSRLDGAPDLVVADVSFISLTLVVPHLLRLAAPGANALVMVKPQFEVGRRRLGSGGVVRSAELRVEAVLTVAQNALEAGARVRAVVPSPLPGPAGNHEYFLWLTAPVRAGDSTSEASLDDASRDEVRMSSRGASAHLLDAAVREAVVAGHAVLVGGPAPGGPGPIDPLEPIRSPTSPGAARAGGGR